MANFLNKKNINFEFIIIANDPDEKEKFYLNKLKDNPAFNILSVPREKLYASWNRGISLTKGDRIGFWNVDDVRFSKSIVEGEEKFKAGADLVYFPLIVAWFFKKIPFRFKRIKPPEFNIKEFTRSMFCGPFFMFSKEFYNRVGPFDEQFKICADFDWCIRAAKNNPKFVLANKCGGIFCVDGTGLSAGRNTTRTVENNVIYKRHKVFDKIVKDESGLHKDYDAQKIFYQEETINFE